MRNLHLILILISALAPAVSAQDTFVPGQLLIRFDPEIADGDQFELIATFGVEIRTHYDLLRMFWVDLPESWDVEQAAAALAKDPRVEFALPNYYGWRVGSGAPVTPNDPQFGNSWGLNNTGQFINGFWAPGFGVADADVDAPEAWCIRTDASAAVIAIIDSGCNLTHADLASNIWVNPADPVNGIDDDGNGLIDDINGWDFLGGNNSPTDSDGHGTRVAGVCSMIGDNGIGGTGVAWTTQTMILKDGNAFPQAALTALSLQYAAAHDVAVVNLSTGYGAAAAPILTPGIDACQAAGIVITVAAGNGTGFPTPVGFNIDGGALDVPAELTQDNLFVIGASTNTDARAGYSNFGPVSVDIAGPGTDVWTTDRFGGYVYETGTSFSAPFAAGCVALVRAHYPSLSHTDVINLFISTADPIAAWSGLTVSGGRLNLNSALLGVNYQVNQAAATFTVNGTTSDGTAAATVTTTAGSPVSIAFQSTLTGNAWDLGFGTAALVPLSAGAVTSSDNQIVNLDLADPSAGTWFGILQTSPPFQSFTVPALTFPVPQSLSAQMAVAAPGNPSGLALSQAVRLIVQ